MELNFAKMRIKIARTNFNFAFVKNFFANKKLNFAKKNDVCQLEKDFLCDIEFRYGGNELHSCKNDSIFGKVEFYVGDFQFCTVGINIHSAKLTLKRYKVLTPLNNDLAY